MVVISCMWLTVEVVVELELTVLLIKDLVAIQRE